MSNCTRHWANNCQSHLKDRNGMEWKMRTQALTKNKALKAVLFEERDGLLVL